MLRGCEDEVSLGLMRSSGGTDQRQVRKDSVILPSLLREASRLQPGRTDHSFSVPRILSPAHEARLLWQRHALQIFPFNGWRLVLTFHHGHISQSHR